MTTQEIKQLVDQRIIENYTGDITAEDVNGILNETLDHLEVSEGKVSELALKVDELDTQINGGNSQEVIDFEFVGNPYSHSSTADLLRVDIAGGESFKVTLSLGTATMRSDITQEILMYGYDSVGAAVPGTMKRIELGTEYDVTAPSDITSIGFYIYAIATSGTFNVNVKKGESIEVRGIVDDIADLSADIQSMKGFEGGNSTTSINVSPNSHSSNNDRIAVNIPKGKEITARLSVGTAVVSVSELIIYFFDKNGNAIRQLNASIDTDVKYTSTTEDIAFVGFYLTRITTGGTMLMNLKWGSGLENKTIAELTEDVERLKNGEETNNIIEASFNVSQYSHSSNNDHIKVGIKKNESFKVRISLGSARMRNSADRDIKIYFFDAQGGTAMSLKNMYLDAETEFLATADIEEISFYMYIIDVAGSVNVRVEKCQSSDLYNTFNQMKRVNVIGSTSQSAQCVLAHFSDIHGSLVNLQRVMNVCHGYKQFIDDVICTGDMVWENIDESDNGTTRGHSYWDKAHAQDTLVCLGNHDSRKAATANTDTDFATEVYPMFIRPYVPYWGNAVHQPNNAEANGLCYYYKDYTSAKVRLVCLDTTPESKDGNRFDSAQQTWLSATLEDARTKGYAVVIANHYGFAAAISTNTRNRFDSLQEYNTDGWVISEIAATIVDTFIANGGDFVCWLAGHTHRDKFTTLDNHNHQVIINVCESLIGGGSGDIARTEGTKSQDAFNIISIDASAKMFRLFRYGADLDRLMRPRKFLTWDYANHTLIND